MSYILDALRRADAERERGAVPGLHAKTMLPGSRDDERRMGASFLVWMAAGAAAVIAAALTWVLSGSEPASPAPMAMPAPAPVMPAPVPATAPAPATAQAQAAGRAPAPALGAAPRIETPAPRVAATTPASAAASERVYTLAELPETVRRELPTLAIGGSIYSEKPASRFLIINGQIFHEGDQVAKDLRLEQIKLKAAVLRYRNYRVGITY